MGQSQQTQGEKCPKQLDEIDLKIIALQAKLGKLASEKKDKNEK
jgi:hypothetical protein